MAEISRVTFANVSFDHSLPPTFAELSMIWLPVCEQIIAD